MKNKFSRVCAISIVFVLLSYLISSPASAQLAGSDGAPGEPCNTKGSVRVTANPEGDGAYILTCDDDYGKWIATISTDLPTASSQVANKEYVDNAVSGVLPPCAENSTELCIFNSDRKLNDSDFVPENIADGVNILGIEGKMGRGCDAIGDRCPDGTIFIGYHPTMHSALYMWPYNFYVASWSYTSYFFYGANSFYDGRANSDLVSDPISAVAECKNGDFGGHIDWYLPAISELQYLWSVRDKIESKTGAYFNFLNAFYWSSTEWDSAYATNMNLWIGTQRASPKHLEGLYALCIRR